MDACKKLLCVTAAIAFVMTGMEMTATSQDSDPPRRFSSTISDSAITRRVFPQQDGELSEGLQPGGQGGAAPGQGQGGDIIEQPTTTAQAPPAPASSLLNQLNILSPQLQSRNVSGQGRQQTAQAPSANIISGAEASGRATTDAGNLLRESNQNVGVYVLQRSPIIGDPRIRSLRFGQYLATADGGSWFPARLDVDSIISKIDSRIIEDVVIVNGPYTSRLGPGFAFIDIATVPPPRYQGTFAEGKSGFSFNTNGDQWYGRQTIQGGADDYGFLVHYSHLTGNDYESGNGSNVPASYKSRNLNAAIGFDIDPHSQVTFRYLRQDQTDVELAGQFTDIDFLVSDAFSVNYSTTDCCEFVRLNVDGWYNRTRAEGSSQRTSKQEMLQQVYLPPQQAFGVTDYDVMSAGYTAAITWGYAGEDQLTIGSDLRVHARSLNETQERIGPFFHPVFMITLDRFTAETLILPDSESVNPGVFAEYVRPVSDALQVKIGARGDTVSLDAGDENIIRRVPGAGNLPLDVLGDSRGQHFDLWSAYVTAEYKLDDVWTLDFGGGFAQRPPTLEEMYSSRQFESILQQGLNRIQGNPLLDAPRLRQIDLGLRADYCNMRFGIRGYHAWINDYITSQAFIIDPTSASLDRVTSVFVNTDLATLAGAEIQGDYDVTSTFALFGNLSYVEGRNQTLNSFLFTNATAPTGSQQGAYVNRGLILQTPGDEPLPQIPPLESRLGFRLHAPGSNPWWGAEFLARIVAEQDRVASGSLLEQATPGFTVYDVRGFWRTNENLTLIGGVLNFTDKQYREHLDSRAGNQLFRPGIGGYVGAELAY